MSIKNNTTYLQSLLSAVNALPSAGGEQMTPEISVSSNGLITATAGTKTSTHQLAFQPAKTITPGTASQIAVSSGYYTGGNVIVGAIPSQYIVPSGTLTISANGTHDVKNYASAVVNVESVGGSGEDAIINGTINGSYTNDRITAIRPYAFYGCKSLTSVNFPACTTIGANAFSACIFLASVNFPACTTIGSDAFHGLMYLTSVNFPVCTTIYNSAFYGCTSLTSVSFPSCAKIEPAAFSSCSSLIFTNFPECVVIKGSAFYGCKSLTSVNFPACTTIGANAFYSCTSLTSVNFPAVSFIGSSAFSRCYRFSKFYLTGSSVCTLSNSNAFTSTPYAGYSTYFSGTPYIYVPASLVSAYKSATNWTYFSSYFSAIESLDDGEEPEEEIQI